MPFSSCLQLPAALIPYSHKLPGQVLQRSPAGTAGSTREPYRGGWHGEQARWPLERVSQPLHCFAPSNHFRHCESLVMWQKDCTALGYGNHPNARENQQRATPSWQAASLLVSAEIDCRREDRIENCWNTELNNNQGMILLKVEKSKINVRFTKR